ncbi:hypothetical protein [Leptospira noumeaensis]|uniref:hypothetical protein n=1 Tax=Leptospira noumeaensis TaxID=2484964 RepID=UPI001FCAF3F2|nr:hypothetical protein [Leptospira noumeaensis]
MTRFLSFLRLMWMRQYLLLFGILATTLWAAPTPDFKFPVIGREGKNTVDPNSSWQIQNRISPQIDGQNIFNILYHTDGKSAIIGTSDYYIYRISLLDGSLIWKIQAKMFYQKEFDGPHLFSVHPKQREVLALSSGNEILILRPRGNIVPW